MATEKQIAYANALLGWHEDRGTLEDAIADLNPDFREQEDITDWFKRLSVKEMSGVISNLKEALQSKKWI
jgi:hypothetical protein